ncbi:MAG: hypothetical protein AAF799_28630 [Myxococcota bacterium]
MNIKKSALGSFLATCILAAPIPAFASDSGPRRDINIELLDESHGPVMAYLEENPDEVEGVVASARDMVLAVNDGVAPADALDTFNDEQPAIADIIDDLLANAVPDDEPELLIMWAYVWVSTICATATVANPN